ncbi:MAG: L-lysine 6-transaminase [Ignavibacteria bacterium]
MSNTITKKKIINTKQSYNVMNSERIKPEEVLNTLRKHMLVDGIDLVVDLKKSKGTYLYDSRKKKNYLDMFSFVASNPVGMNHPKMNNPEFIEHIGRIALSKPSNSDIYCMEMAEFVETFFDIAVPSYFKYSFFIEGGALAIENALKTAFDWKIKKNFKKGFRTEKGTQVIHFKLAFHGRTGYTMSLTNTDPVESIKTALYPKFKWPRITAPIIKFPLNENNLDEVIKLEEQAVKEIKNAVVENKDDIACLIIEPIQGEGGDNHFRKEFFEKLRTICEENEILFILDEVQTGLGMTGKWWAHQHFVQPDIIAFGKKSQVCGILVTDKIDDIENNAFHEPSRLNSTWGGNLVDMVRFKKYLEIIKEEDLVENAKINGEYLLTKLNELENKYPKLVSNTRGRGLFCAMDLPDGGKRDKLREKIFNNNVILLGSGISTIRFRPPLNITKEQINEGVSVIDNCLKDMQV